MNHEYQYYIRYANYDNDIPSNLECAKTADNFSHKIIPLIIKDDPEAFLEIVSSPEFDHDGTLLQARERFYLSDYLYQPFFDELTGPTVLSVAAFFKAEKIVETILGLPIVDKTDSLHFACAGGSLNIVRMLFNQEESDIINKDRVRPITIASYFGNVDVVKYLYSHGCPIINPKENNSCINKAAFNGNINVLDFFREIDPDLVKKLRNYGHPINSAAKGGQPECVKYLIKYGKPSRSDIFTALISSCKSGSLSCVKILFEYYLNKGQDNGDDENKKSNSKRRKKKKDDDDDEFIPGAKKVKKKKLQNDDDVKESNENEENEESFITIYNAAISNFHLDVLHYLLMKKPINSMDSILSFAIFQIKYNELLARILSPSYLRSSHLYENNDSLINNWLKKSALALKTAKYILMNYQKCPFTDSFFEKVTNEIYIDSVIYFLNEINFKINQNSSLSNNQILFFRLAFLMANTKTIPMLKKIMNNIEINIFNDEFFKPLKDKRNIDYSDPNYYLNSDESESEEEETVSYITKELIINAFKPYIKTMTKREFAFCDESAMFLIENHFPFYLLADLDNLPINTFTLNLPFFKACLKLGYFDYAKKFLLLMPLDFFFDALLEIFDEANKKFNQHYDPKHNQNVSMQKLKENRLDGALKVIRKFNQGDKQSNNLIEFNIFNYECKNKEENEIYQQYMSLIKMVIRVASNNDGIALLLCSNGLSKEWIIEQTKGETDDSINPISNSPDLNKSKIESKISKNRKKNEKKATKVFPFLAFFTKKQIPDDWYANSLNPLINTTIADNLNDLIRSSSSDSLKILDVLKFYINNGIDVSSGTEYAELLWKKVIENNKGSIARVLIQYGKADKNLYISNSKSQNLSLFDFALEKKAISILLVFLENEFYPQDSLINTDPNSIVINLNNESADHSFDLRENNLKIISLIYKYKEGNYDVKLKKKLINELLKLMVPLKNTKTI